MTVAEDTGTVTASRGGDPKPIVVSIRIVSSFSVIDAARREPLGGTYGAAFVA